MASPPAIARQHHGDIMCAIDRTEITAQGRPEDFEGDLHEQVRSWLGINF